ncbi:MAG: Flp family type IVb pilin [Phycisphaerae bacterium]
MIQSLITRAKWFIKTEDGPTTVEYAVMLALIVGVVISIVGVLGTKTNQAISDFNSDWDAAGGGGS